MHELYVYKFSFCMNLMYIIRCRLYFVSHPVCRLYLFLQTECILCFLSSSNGWADVSMSVATVNSSSDRRMTPAQSSLLGAIVATDVFYPWLLSYKYSDVLVTTGQWLQWLMVYWDSVCSCMFVVVLILPFIMIGGWRMGSASRHRDSTLDRMRISIIS
jgi:hypothetical protein